jgi:hypothetical protein
MIDIAEDKPGVVAPAVGTIPLKDIFPATEVRQKTGCGIGSVFLFSGLTMVTSLALAEWYSMLLTPAYACGVVTGMGLVGAATSIGYATTFWKKDEEVTKELTDYERKHIYGAIKKSPRGPIPVPTPVNPESDSSFDNPLVFKNSLREVKVLVDNVDDIKDIESMMSKTNAGAQRI